MTAVHTPCLLQECISLLSPAIINEKNPVMCDSTLGEGGHTEAFLTEFPHLKILGLDADPFIQERAKERLRGFGGRVSFFNIWAKDFYKKYPSECALPSAILFDLGISIFHYELSSRGFSFKNDEELDMRLSPACARSARDIVNGESEEKLAAIIFEYGEEKFSRRIARAIVEERSASEIKSSKALSSIIYNAVPEYYRHGRIHPATRTFQALRIEVNGELSNLLEMLHPAFNRLKESGRLAVITFHSLEDRIVKNYFKALGKKCVCPKNFPKCVCGGIPSAEVVTKKPVLPSEEEVSANSPSRSAKLRVVKKIRDATDLHLKAASGNAA